MKNEIKIVKLILTFVGLAGFFRNSFVFTFTDSSYRLMVLVSKIVI